MDTKIAEMIALDAHIYGRRSAAWAKEVLTQAIRIAELEGGRLWFLNYCLHLVEKRAVI